MLVLKLFAVAAIACIVAGVWMTSGPGIALITLGAIVYADMYMPPPGGRGS